MTAFTIVCSNWLRLTGESWLVRSSDRSLTMVTAAVVVISLGFAMTRSVMALGEYPVPINLPDALIEMARASVRMLSDALSSLANNDTALCSSVRDC